MCSGTTRGSGAVSGDGSAARDGSTSSSSSTPRRARTVGARGRGRRQPTSGPGRDRSRPSRTAPSPARAPSPRPSPARTRGARRPRPGIQPAPCRGRVRAASASASGTASGSSRASSSSANRSSWIQSARPETPTPSSRTPPEVSSSASRLRASLLTSAGRSVGPAMVADRVNVVKSCSRTLRVTVRPDSLRLASAARRRCVRAGRRSPRAGPGRRGRARTCPRPTPTSSRARRPRAGRRRLGPARTGSTPCAWPTHPDQLLGADPAQLLDGVTPTWRSRPAVAGPTPGMTVTCIGREQVQLRSRAG